MDFSSLLMEAVKGFIGAFLVVALPLFGTLLGKILVALLNSIKNPTIRNLAVQAVLWAEDKWGAGNGSTKLEGAIKFLMEKAKLSREDAEKAVRAAYQSVWGEFPKESPSA